MARREPPSLPQPPWVWGTSEVEEWIRGAYPAKGRRRTGERQGPAVVTRLRIRLETSSVPEVRAVFAEILEAAGIRNARATRRREGRPQHVAVASIGHELVRGGVRISARFAPPIHRSTVARIVDRLSRAFLVRKVEATEKRARLPRRRP